MRVNKAGRLPKFGRPMTNIERKLLSRYGVKPEVTDEERKAYSESRKQHRLGASHGPRTGNENRSQV